MPRYVFRLSISDVQDATNVFSDDEAACREARTVARELARANLAAPHEYLQVFDEVGRFIHQEPVFWLDPPCALH